MIGLNVAITNSQIKKEEIASGMYNYVEQKINKNPYIQFNQIEYYLIFFTEKEKEGLIITSEKLVLSFLDRHIGEIKDRYPDQDFALNFRAPSHISVRISSSVDDETANKIRDFILHQVFDEKNLISAGGHTRAFGIRLQDLSNEEVIQHIKVIFDKIQNIL